MFCWARRAKSRIEISKSERSILHVFNGLFSTELVFFSNLFAKTKDNFFTKGALNFTMFVSLINESQPHIIINARIFASHMHTKC